jgi:hypothetical protein
VLLVRRAARRVLALLASGLLVGCGAADARPEAAAERSLAVPPALEELLPLLPESVSVRLRAPRVIAAELDGRAPAEAVLAADVLGDGGRLEASQVWIFMRRGGGLTVVEDKRWPMSQGAGLDDALGIRAFAAERMLSASADVLRIERTDAEHGQDPRYFAHTLDVLRLTPRGLETVLSCPLVSSQTRGPTRATYEAKRTLDVRGRFPRLVVVTAEVTFDPGVGEGAGDAEDFDPSFAEHQAAGLREATYAFDGRRYATVGPDLCAEPP